MNLDVAPAPRSAERGVAIVLSLFLMMAMSVIAASVMFMAQTETYGTMNYRMMSQARYAAESGVQKTANYLLSDGYQQIKPGTASDPLSAYDTTVSPVTLKSNGKAVVLSAFSSPTASCPSENYANSTVVTAFSNNATAAKGTLSAGKTKVNYVACARLMSMQLTESSGVVQRWEITAVGTVGGARPATEEVTATLETQIVPTHGYAAFATAAGCGAMTLQGGVTTASYDSTAYSGDGSTTPATTNSDADIGTNGNLSEGGKTTVINGKLYTPRHGVGNCTGGNVTALSQNGGASVKGMIEMPQTWSPPVPSFPVPDPATVTTTVSIDSSTTCDTPAFKSAYQASGATCSVVSSGGANYVTVKPNGAVPISWGNVSVTSGATVSFLPGTYNFNSLSVSQTNTRLSIGDPRPVGTAGLVGGAVTMTLLGRDVAKTVDINSSGTLAVPANRETSLVMNIATSNQSNNSPLNVTGGGVFENKSYDPQLFGINYPGTGSMSVSGGAATAFVLNAPNADLTLTGGSYFYGSLIVRTLTNTGGTSLYYDMNLGTLFGVAGNPLLTSFSWKRF